MLSDCVPVWPKHVAVLLYSNLFTKTIAYYVGLISVTGKSSSHHNKMFCYPRHEGIQGGNNGIAPLILNLGLGWR